MEDSQRWVENLALQWCYNEPDGVSNHQPHDCILKRLFRCRSKKTSKFRVTGLCAWNSPVTGEFPAQRASNVENVFIWWRHHGRLLTESPHSPASWSYQNCYTQMLLKPFNKFPWEQGWTKRNLLSKSTTVERLERETLCPVRDMWLNEPKSSFTWKWPLAVPLHVRALSWQQFTPFSHQVLSVSPLKLKVCYWQ